MVNLATHLNHTSVPLFSMEITYIARWGEERPFEQLLCLVVTEESQTLPRTIQTTIERVN